jgi:hypothetical protein
MHIIFSPSLGPEEGGNSLAESKIEGADLVLIKPIGFSHLRSIAERFLPSI